MVHDLAGVVTIVDALTPPSDSSVIAHLLTPGSIRVVLEGHEPAWERVDVVVQRPQAGQVVSMAGLLVAALARAPRFDVGLSEFVKAYVRPISPMSQNGPSLVLAPIPVSVLPPTYLNELRATNRRLRQMA